MIMIIVSFGYLLCFSPHRTTYWLELMFKLQHKRHPATTALLSLHQSPVPSLCSPASSSSSWNPPISINWTVCSDIRVLPCYSFKKSGIKKTLLFLWYLPPKSQYYHYYHHYHLLTSVALSLIKYLVYRNLWVSESGIPLQVKDFKYIQYTYTHISMIMHPERMCVCELCNLKHCSAIFKFNHGTFAFA